MSLLGYLFAEEMNSLAGYIEKASWAISGGLFAAGYYLWRRKKKQMRERKNS
jgi:hypothetical protein